MSKAAEAAKVAAREHYFVAATVVDEAVVKLEHLTQEDTAAVVAQRLQTWVRRNQTQTAVRDQGRLVLRNRRRARAPGLRG